METKRLFLKRSEYNSYRIIEELSKIINNHNGVEVENVYPFKLGKIEYTITDITTYNKINEIQDRLAHYNNLLAKEQTKEWQQSLEKSKQAYIKELAELEQIKDAETRTTTHANYIMFYFDNYIYYIQLNENPFFEHFFSKVPCKRDGNKFITSYQYLSEQVNVDCVTDYIFNELADADCKELANQLWNIATSMAPCKINCKREKVQNTFNEHYHFENIPIKQQTTYEIKED